MGNNRCFTTSSTSRHSAKEYNNIAQYYFYCTGIYSPEKEIMPKISSQILEMESLVEADDEDHKRKIDVAKQTCRQRRIATYLMLGVYIVLAIYVFRFRKEV